MTSSAIECLLYVLSYTVIYYVFVLFICFQYARFLREVDAGSPEEEIQKLRQECEEGSRVMMMVRKDLKGSLGEVGV